MGLTAPIHSDVEPVLVLRHWTAPSLRHQLVVVPCRPCTGARRQPRRDSPPDVHHDILDGARSTGGAFRTEGKAALPPRCRDIGDGTEGKVDVVGWGEVASALVRAFLQAVLGGILPPALGLVGNVLRPLGRPAGR